MDQQVAYEEAGRVHRYMLGWRHAAFAGYFVILYGIASLVEKFEEQPNVVTILLFAASCAGIVLFFIDVRTRELYNAAVQAGNAIECGEPGNLFARLAIPPRWWPRGVPGPHSAMIWLVYWLGSAALFVAFWGRLCR